MSAITQENTEKQKKNALYAENILLQRIKTRQKQYARKSVHV